MTTRPRGHGAPAYARGASRAPVHPLVLPFRLLAILAAQLFDVATFILMVERHGIAAELNPVIAAGFATFGLPVLILMKAALVILLASIVVILDRGAPAGRARLAWPAIVTLLAVTAGLMGGISNALAI